MLRVCLTKLTPFYFILLSLLIMISALSLTGCASSSVERGAASGVDGTVAAAQGLYANADDDYVNTYQNMNQTSRGALLGGAAGALAGSMYPRVGFISGAAIAAVVGAGIGAYIDAHTTLEDRLMNRGVRTIVLGDQILIVLPSARIFKPMTGNISPQAYSTLNMVVQYINRYTKILVKINAYTNPLGPKEINRAISVAEARSVERYLVGAGMDARIVFADGCGGMRPVSPVGLDWDSNENYRVEITLEKLTV